MKGKKKIKAPSVTEIFEKWCPEEKAEEYLELLAYNYKKSDTAGFEKIKGIAAIGKEKILCCENGNCVSRLNTADYQGVVFLKDGGSCRLLLKKGEERFLLATADLRYAEHFSAVSGALESFFEGKEYRSPLNDKVGRCPKCGAAYPKGGTLCVRCGGRKKQMAWLGSIVKPLLPWLVLSFFLFALISGIGLIAPRLSQEMVDGYLKNENAGEENIFPYLLVVLALLGCTVIKQLLSALRNYLSAKIGSRAIRDLRDSVFSKIQKLTLSGVNRRTVGELMQRVGRDTMVIRQFLTSTLGEIIEKTVTFLAIAGILIYQDVTHGSYLFLLIFIPVFPALLLFRMFRRKVNRMYYSQWLVESKANTVLHDIFSGIRVVKAYGREQAEIEHYDGAVQDVRNIQKRNDVFWSIFSPALNFILCFGEFFVLFVVGNKILNMEMTLGEMTKLTAYASMIYTPLRSMAMIPRRIMHAMNSLSRIYDLMEDPDVISSDENTLTPELTGRVTVENVRFGYQAGQTVLKNVSLDIRPGEMIGLVGRSGVGKTTLVNLIMRLYSPDEGKILLDGYDLASLSGECLRKNIGTVLQDTFLFAGTIRDNIAYAKPNAEGKEIIAAAKIAGAHDFIIRLKDGYDTYVGERGYTLSGGERQRIAIARAVLLDPKILILDEATSALDTETERKIQEALAKLIEGRTTIAIAHRLSTLRNATRIVVLDDKGIAEEGTHEQLMRNENGIYYGLVMAQRKMTEKREKTIPK